MKSFVLIGAMLTISASAATAAANDSVVFQDFGGKITQTGQNALAAALAYRDSSKAPWLGGGWWYSFASAGAALKTGAGVVADTGTHIKALWSDSLLRVKFTVPNDATGDIYLGLGTGIFGDGSKSYDLTGLTSVNIEARGTGTVRFKWDTKDELDATLADTWGTYGFSLALTPAWKTFSIPLASFTGSQYSALAKTKQTLAHGLDAVYKVAFQISDTTDAELYLKSIVFKGITLASVKQTGSTGVLARTHGQELSFATVRNGFLDVSLESVSNVAVHDLTGNSMISYGRLEAGSHTFPLTGLKTGTYIVRLSGAMSTKAFPVQVLGR